MRILKTSAAIALSLLATLSCHAEGRWSRFGRLDGKSYSTSVTYSTLSQTPAWKLGSDDIPVTQPKAAELAGSALKEQFPDQASFQLESITLQYNKQVDRWAYTLRYLREYSPQEIQAAGGGLTADQLSYFVLLDGSVVKPMPVEKRKSKDEKAQD